MLHKCIQWLQLNQKRHNVLIEISSYKTETKEWNEEGKGSIIETLTRSILTIKCKLDKTHIGRRRILSTTANVC